MDKATRKDAQQDERPEARDGRASNRKKIYQKPVLAKHEQLHGIGLGS